MARKKKVEAVPVEVEKKVDVLAELRAFRDELQRDAELTDDARSKFGVLAIDNFLAKISPSA